MSAIAVWPATSAVLSIDFQRDIIADSSLAPSDPEALDRFDAVVDQAARFLDAARQAGCPVIHVRIAFSPGYPEASPHVPMTDTMRAHGALVEGSPGAAFDSRVAPRDGEAVITKRGVSAFAATELDRALRIRGIDTVLVAGLVSHYAVEGTARHASDLGYRTVVLSDCCSSGGLDRHEMAMRNLAPLCAIAESGDVTFVERPA